MTVEIEEFDWTIDSPLEKADAKYIIKYFECRNTIARQRMQQKSIASQFLVDASSALVGFVQDEKEQKALWDLKRQLLIEKTAEYEKRGEEINDATLMIIRNEISDEIMARVHVWFSRFWSITQMQSLRFEKKVDKRTAVEIREGETHENKTVFTDNPLSGISTGDNMYSSVSGVEEVK